MEHATQIDEILHVEGLIEVVIGLEVIEHIGRQGALAIEGAAGGKPQNDKTDGNRDQRYRNGRQHAPQGVSQHFLVHLLLRGAGTVECAHPMRRRPESNL
jgi:hypothetical protein